jgi:hypothetical protein
MKSKGEERKRKGGEGRGGERKGEKKKGNSQHIFVFMYGLFDCTVRNSDEAMPTLYRSCGTVELSLSNN